MKTLGAQVRPHKEDNYLGGQCDEAGGWSGPQKKGKREGLGMGSLFSLESNPTPIHMQES